MRKRRHGSGAGRAACLALVVAAAALLGAARPAHAGGGGGAAAAAAAAAAAGQSPLAAWLLPLLRHLPAALQVRGAPTSGAAAAGAAAPPAPPAFALDYGAAPNASLLAVGAESGWWAFDAASGARLDAGRRVPGGKRAWSAAVIRPGPGGGRMFMPSFFGDPFSSANFRGAVQAFDASGAGPLRRFDRRHPNFDLRRPGGFLWVDGALPCGAVAGTGAGPAAAAAGAGGVGGGEGDGCGDGRRVRRMMVVAAAGNDALPAYDAESGRLLGLLARGDNTTASTQGPRGLALSRDGGTLFVATQGSWASGTGLSFPPHLRPALLAIDLATGRARQLAALPAASAGRFVSLDWAPAAALPAAARAKAVAGGGGNVTGDVLVASDTAGQLRWYSPASGALLHVVDAAAAAGAALGAAAAGDKAGAAPPAAAAAAAPDITFGEMRAGGGFIYLVASAGGGGGGDGAVLRFTAGGAPAGRGASAVWVGPVAGLKRALGLALL
ncbi:MAG: hypothetical protein J3K34DRAFT_489930 [Monoraphidium minutum]|nr:MAG: hypothetical protein J3K34DRAFT_489930 [Monoraphidium minutum]